MEYTEKAYTNIIDSIRCEVGGASRHSTGFGALEEGLISS